MLRDHAPGEYYHVLNRGNQKSQIFKNESDKRRFLFLLLYFQAPEIAIPDVSAMTKEFQYDFVIEGLAKKIIQHRGIELICFALMDNYFHLCLKEDKKGGISKYMQRVQNSYTKYFNTRYKSSGHLFQGPYKIVHVDSDYQLLHLSAYIHRNPRELPGIRDKEHKYPWSSYQDYTEKNRWGNLLVRNIILDQFDSANAYDKYLKTSNAKLLDEELTLDN